MAFVKKVNNRYIVCTRLSRKKTGSVSPNEICRIAYIPKCIGKYGVQVIIGDFGIVAPKELIGKKVRLYLELVEENAILTTQYNKI